MASSNLSGPGMAKLHLGARTRLVEDTLHDLFLARGVPGASELRESRLPRVEELEAIRDEAGRLTATRKGLVVDPAHIA